MKKIFTSLFIATLALATAVSCDKGNEAETTTEGKALTINFIADDDIALSRTELDATGKKAAWVEGDAIQLAYYKNGTGWSAGWDHSDSEATIDTDGKASFKFSTWVSSSITSLDFWFIYPYAGQSGVSSKVEDGVWAGFIVPSEQTPTLTSFDGKADILVGQPVHYESTADTEFTVKFIRKAGFLKLRFAGIAESLASQEVKSVTVAAQEGAVLAGENLCANIDKSVDGTTADPYSFSTNEDSKPTNVLVADYSAKNITVADLQTTEAGKGVWLSMLPAEISSLTVTIETKSGSKIEFAERATAGLAVKENEITPITLTFDSTKGDKATKTTLTALVLTITNTADGLAGAVTDAEGNPVEINAVEEYGLTTTLGTGTYFWISSSSSSAYIRNTKAIGDYITKLTIKGSGSNDGYKYTTGTAAITSNSGSNSTGTTTKSFTAADGIKYFNVSKHNSKTGKITSIVIEYTVSTTTEL